MSTIPTELVLKIPDLATRSIVVMLLDLVGTLQETVNRLSLESRNAKERSQNGNTAGGGGLSIG